jgi:hypothetical protein
MISGWSLQQSEISQNGEREMRAVTKVYLTITFFFGMLLAYLLLLTLWPTGSLCRLTGLCESVPVNCAILVAVSLVAAFVLAQITDFCYCKILEIKWRSSRLGKILVNEGYVTEQELAEALSEQNLRLGEVLVSAGRITPEQLERALGRQKSVSRRLGEVLKELEYITDEDIEWAMESLDKKLGQVLLKRGVLTDYDLNSSLALQRYGPRWVQRAWRGKIIVH